MLGQIKMMQTRKVDSIEQLGELKAQYMDQTIGPLDGMWLCGFVPMATHFGFYDDDQLVGFCCLNEEGYLLQFFLCTEYQARSTEVFATLLENNDSAVGQVKGAFVSTAEPQFLSLCLDSFSAFKVNALMYRRDQSSSVASQAIELKLVDMEQLTETVRFVKSSVDVREQWLSGYLTNLINRQELFGYWQDGGLVATGESRGYDEYQLDYADLGVIVAERERGKGLATRVLRQLVAITEGKDLTPICSTEKTNIGAQKAIGRAGFFAANRIIQFDI